MVGAVSFQALGSPGSFIAAVTFFQCVLCHAGLAFLQSVVVTLTLQSALYLTNRNWK